LTVLYLVLAAVVLAAPLELGLSATRLSRLVASGRLILPAPTPGIPSGASAASAVSRATALSAVTRVRTRTWALFSAVLAVPVGIGVGVGVGASLFAILVILSMLCSDAIESRIVASRDRDRLAMIQLVVLELESGAPLDVALNVAASVGGSLAASVVAAAALCRDGADPTHAFDDDPQLHRMAAAWSAAAGCGTPVAVVLSKVRADLVFRSQHRMELISHLSAARASVGLLAVLPVLGLLLGGAMGAHPLKVLTGTPAGQLLLVVGVAFDVGGVLWTRSILRSAMR
jgi:tight adherence protein B